MISTWPEKFPNYIKNPHLYPSSLTITSFYNNCELIILVKYDTINPEKIILDCKWYLDKLTNQDLINDLIDLSVTIIGKPLKTVMKTTSPNPLFSYLTNLNHINI